MKSALFIILYSFGVFTGSLQAADSFSSKTPNDFVIPEATVGASCTFGTIGVSADKDFLSCVSGVWVQSASLSMPGTHCGMANSMRLGGHTVTPSSCKGFNPRYSCPSGYIRVNYYDLGVEQGGKPVDRRAGILSDYYTCFKR